MSKARLLAKATGPRVRVVVTEGRDVSVATRPIRSTDPISTRVADHRCAAVPDAAI